MHRFRVVALFWMLVVSVDAVRAEMPARGGDEGGRGGQEAADEVDGGRGVFDAGRFELEVGLVPFASLQRTTRRRPAIDDVGGHLRAGLMLTSPSGSGRLRGNFELLAAAQVSAVVRGPGKLFAGGSFVVRRNFVQPDARWIPYAQLEAGLVYTDVHDDRSQRVIGQSMEFLLGGGFGLRRLLGNSWAAYGEVDYRHVSNAGLAEQNLGLNSIGALFGVARLF